MKWVKLLHNKLIITKENMLEISGLDKVFTITALYDDNQHMIEVQCEPQDAVSILGNIYIGKVKDIVQNLDAAFIDIGHGITCYYSLHELHHPIFTKKMGKKILSVGDELLVQVVKEAMKTKFPVVTTNLSITGKYAVLTTENTMIGVSSKLHKDTKDFYKEALSSYASEEYGWIVRTNAKDVNTNLFLDEIHSLREQYTSLRNTSIHKTCFSCLLEAPKTYVKKIMDQYLMDLDEIITDDAACFADLQSYIKDQVTEKLDVLHLYEDSKFSLSNLYNIRGQLEHALEERVWLKSGAYLIIQPTEALTVIDVNSGKNAAKKNPQENFLKINIEAAKEIAAQLRLRNISGICIVDFINLDTKEAMDELMHAFRISLKSDPIPVRLIDITKLGLVEITRKKVRKSLKEQV